MKIERQERWFSNPPYISSKKPLYKLTPETEEEAKILNSMANELYRTRKALELRFFVYPDGERSNPKHSENSKGLCLIVNGK